MSASSVASRSEPPDDLSCILKKLRPFQREAFDFATKGTTYSRQWADESKDNKLLDTSLLGKGRILLCDEMGLGKTVTSLAIMTAYKDEWPLLILCPASLRYTWPAEIEKFLPTIPASAIYVVSGFDDADFFQNEQKRRRIKIVVATYSLLQTRSAAARVLPQFEFKCVIADESHNLKEKKSQRCKLAMPLLQKAKRLVLLSGTPALARPVELWPQVYCIAPNLFGSYTAYTKRHCNAKRGRFGWDVSGLSHADELHKKLRQIMVRRLKSNVLSELPPKQRSIVPMNIDPSKVRECRDLMEQLAKTKLSVSELLGNEANQAHFEHRRLLMQAYQASGIGKANSVAEYLLDWLTGSGTQKILVFAHHQQVMDTLEQAVAKKFKGVGHIRIDGTVPSGERAVRVRKFQTNSQVRVAILSMTAAGVGLTLTAASSVMFAELHWTPGVLAQGEDRCHRIGQANAVNVMYCICKEPSLSVDTRLWAMLSRKVGTLGKVIDGVNVSSTGTCFGNTKCRKEHMCLTVAMMVPQSASMDVHETSSGEMLHGKAAAGESVEDELSRFFAETSANERKPKAPPVKGSIKSFFQPPAAKKPADVDAPATKPSKIVRQAAGVSSRAKFIKASPEVVEWTCESCTYINSRTKSADGWLSCELCGNIHVESDTGDDEGIPTVSPSNVFDSKEPSRNKSPDVLDLSQDSIVSTKRKQRPADVIVLDIDNDQDSRSKTTPRLSKKGRQILDAQLSKASSSVKTGNEVIEIDLESGSLSKPTSSLTDPLVIDVDSPVSRTVITPAQAKTKSVTPKGTKPSILNFSVSKNSGRITILSASSGDSFHINFDIDQVVTAETADSLLNAKVNRSVASVRASDDTSVVSFCDNAVTRGKFYERRFCFRVKAGKVKTNRLLYLKQSFIVSTLETASRQVARLKNNVVTRSRRLFPATYPFARSRRRH